MKIIALVATSAILISGHRALEERPLYQQTLKEVSVNGTTIRYLEQGRGVPVVFVHGAISDHRYWELQREVVAKRYRFIAIDRRYFGTAPWPDTGVRISQETDAADLAAFIRALKIGPAVLVGTSAGGSVVLVTAVRSPTLVRALFVNEPGLRSIVTDSADRRLVTEGDANLAARDAAVAGNMVEAARFVVDRNSSPGSFDRLPPTLRQMFVDNARALTVPGSREPGDPITCEQLGWIRVPVTITEGALTARGRKIMDAAVRRCIPQSRLVTIPSAHHSGPRENPSAFNAALLAFFAGT
jgi:pimeloyl-ACP methyl ester carboxylesterase